MAMTLDGHAPLHFSSELSQIERLIRADMAPIDSGRCRLSRPVCLMILVFNVVVFVSFSVTVLVVSNANQRRRPLLSAHHANKVKETRSTTLPPKSKYTYENLTLWNRSLCSARSDRRGPHQKIVSISVYGSSSKHTDNPMYSWAQSIFPFLEPLAREVKLLEPSWVIRLYTDFTGSTRAQRELLSNLSNVDVCNMSALPLFGSTDRKSVV